jgi:hypothetical protein
MPPQTLLMRRKDRRSRAVQLLGASAGLPLHQRPPWRKRQHERPRCQARRPRLMQNGAEFSSDLPEG